MLSVSPRVDAGFDKQALEGHLVDPGGSTDNEHAEFIENLLCERFNFLLVFYALTVGGALQTDEQRTFNVVLTFGAVLATVFAFPIARAQFKLALILGPLDTPA